jgi:hypothetical protein
VIGEAGMLARVLEIMAIDVLIAHRGEFLSVPVADMRWYLSIFG